MSVLGKVTLGFASKYITNTRFFHASKRCRDWKRGPKLVGRPPRRAVLYVPGNDERKIRKLESLEVDCAVLDCEDGVAMTRKKDARESIRENYSSVTTLSYGEVCVRVNSASSGLMEEDLDVIFGGEEVPTSVMLPKVENWQEIELFFNHLNPKLKNNHVREVKLIIFCETALGLLNLRKIIESSIAFSAGSLLQIEGIVFGSDDFCASIGVERTKDSLELLYARQKIVAYAKAFDLQVIDMVYIDYKDQEGLKKQSLEGASMGFTGKQVIHPDQIKTVQQCFVPTEAKIKWATELMRAFVEHQAFGVGAFTFQGQMIDMPLLKQARGIVDMKDLIKNSE